MQRSHLGLTRSLWSAGELSEIIFQAPEFHTQTPASNSNCSHLLLLHWTTFLASLWRTDTNETREGEFVKIYENTSPSPKRAPEKKYTGYIFTGSKSEEQCTDVWWWLWPVLMSTPMATLTVPWLKPLRAAFRAAPTKESQQFCPERLPIYKDHSLSLRKRLGKGHVSKMWT